MRHVFLCADANFVVPLAVTLRSLAESQPSPAELHVTVLSVGITLPDQHRIRAFAPPLVLDFVSIENHIPVDSPKVRHLNLAAYGRLLGVDFLTPEVQRAVYLDADVIVWDDLDSSSHLTCVVHLSLRLNQLVFPMYRTQTAFDNGKVLDYRPRRQT